MENIRNFLLTLTAAISNCSMYSKDHPAVDEFHEEIGQGAGYPAEGSGKARNYAH